MERKQQQPLRNSYELEYGLMMASWDTETSAVSSVACLFSISFGREENVGQKRKSKTTKKYLKAPFRPILCREHRASQHPSGCAEYSSALDDSELIFFHSVAPVANCVTSYYKVWESGILLGINSGIFNLIISELFFDPEYGRERL